MHPIRSYSSLEVIPGRSHTSLRVLRVSVQFREMGKIPQIIGMNRQKVFQNLFLHTLYPNWSLSSSKIM